MKFKALPFYENFDGTHCAQCVLRGILEYFEPQKSWTWEELDAFTAKEPDKWTWPQRGIINMIKRGYDVVSIDDVNIKEYIDLGIYETLEKNLGKEAADKQKLYADFDKVLVDIKEYHSLSEKGLIKRHERVPTFEDMKNYLNEGYLLSCTLNPYALYDLEGYAGHIVLVYDVDDEYVYFQDSGKRIIRPEGKEPIDKFINACKDPTPSQWTLVAYKKL